MKQNKKLFESSTKFIFKKSSLSPKKSFTKVTGKSLRRLRAFHAEDETNLTITERNTRQYARLLGMKSAETLENIILEQAKKSGRKIKLFDAGCGQAHAIDELLSNIKLNSALESCSGVSKHYFSSIKDVINRHPRRFNYFLGTAQDVLSKSHAAYDLIFDVCGAVLYSEDKLALFNYYHQALTPGGKAYVYIGVSNGLLISMITDKERKNFLSQLADDYPDTFSVQHTVKYDIGTYTIVTITKSSERFPVPKHRLASADKCSTIGPSELSFFELNQGNAVAPIEVHYEASPDNQYNLRLLKF